jgi:hypothetical protein
LLCERSVDQGIGWDAGDGWSGARLRHVPRVTLGYHDPDVDSVADGEVVRLTVPAALGRAERLTLVWA